MELGQLVGVGRGGAPAEWGGRDSLEVGAVLRGSDGGEGVQRSGEVLGSDLEVG